MNQAKRWIAFQHIPDPARVRLSLLENRFSAVARAWGAPALELLASGLEPKLVSAVLRHRPHLSPEQEMKKLGRLRAGVE